MEAKETNTVIIKQSMSKAEINAAIINLQKDKGTIQVNDLSISWNGQPQNIIFFRTIIEAIRPGGK
jgi:hypothetical protein